MNEDAKARAAMEKRSKQLSKAKEEDYSGKGKGKAVAVDSDTDINYDDYEYTSDSDNSYGYLSDIESSSNNIPRRPNLFQTATQTDFYSGQGHIDQYTPQQLKEMIAFSEQARASYGARNVPASKPEISRLL